MSAFRRNTCETRDDLEELGGVQSNIMTLVCFSRLGGPGFDVGNWGMAFLLALIGILGTEVCV